MNKKNLKIQKMVVLAMLIALYIIFSRLLSLNIGGSHKISFTFICIALMGCLYSPYVTAISCAGADFIGCMLFPKLTYFPGFTLTAFLVGLVFGIVFSNKVNFVRILIATGLTCLIQFFVNSFWLKIICHVPYSVMLISRIPQECIMAVVMVILLSALFKLDIIQRKIKMWH